MGIWFDIYNTNYVLEIMKLTLVSLDIQRHKEDLLKKWEESFSTNSRGKKQQNKNYFEMKYELEGFCQKTLNGGIQDPVEQVRFDAYQELFDYRRNFSLDYDLEIEIHERGVTVFFDDFEEFQKIHSGEEELSSDRLPEDEIDANLNNGYDITNHWLIDGTGGVHVHELRLKSDESQKTESQSDLSS